MKMKKQMNSDKSCRGKGSHRGSKYFRQVNDVSQIDERQIQNLKMAIKFKDIEIADRRSSLGSQESREQRFDSSNKATRRSIR